MPKLNTSKFILKSTRLKILDVFWPNFVTDPNFVYDDRQSTFEELLNIDKSVTIHHRNLQVLATELYKVHHGLAPELMSDIF